MPITAKLSNKFYEKLGDDVANELVGLLNLVDTSYRQEFRELFEANFGRVEARLGAMDARLAGFEATMDARLAGFEATMDARLAGFEATMDARLSGLGSRLETRVHGVEGRMTDLEASLLAKMDAKLEALKSELLKWMFLFWVGTMGTVLAIVKL